MKKLICMMCSLLLFVALGMNYNNVKAQESVITLSINPSFEIVVDNNNKISNIKALNKDAQKVLNAYDDYFVGQDVKEVLNSLIKESNELGYFNKDLEGFEKDVVISMKKGSVDLDTLKGEVENVLNELSLTSETIMVAKNDFNDKNTADNSGTYISEEKAKEIVAKRIGASIEEIEFIEKEFELEKDRHIYDFEVIYNGETYEIDIDASTGAIIEVAEESKDDLDDDLDDHEDDEDDLEENNDDSDEIDDDDFAGDTDNEDEGDDDSSDDTDDDEDEDND